jgi:hypothetical protein
MSFEDTNDRVELRRDTLLVKVYGKFNPSGRTPVLWMNLKVKETV